MMRLATVLGAVTLLALPGVAGTISYTFNDLGFMGDSTTPVTGFVSSGELVGSYVFGSGSFAFADIDGNLVQYCRAGNCTTPAAILGWNNNGRMVGYAGATTSSSDFVYDGATFMSFPPSGFPSGTNFVEASGVDPIGFVVGLYAQSGIAKAFTDNNATINNGILAPRATASVFTGINASDTIVGHGTSGGGSKGVTDNAGTLASPFLPAGTSAICFNAIDSAGDIVGLYPTGWTAACWGPFQTTNILSNPATMQNFKNLGNSSNGNEIVGSSFGGSTVHGFHAALDTGAVPEPDTVLLSLSGIGLLAGWGWRRQRKANK